MTSLKRLREGGYPKETYEDRFGCSYIPTDVFLADYENVFKLLNSRIPVETLADKKWPMEKLREFNLLMNEKEEAQFRDLFEVSVEEGV